MLQATRFQSCITRLKNKLISLRHSVEVETPPPIEFEKYVNALQKKSYANLLADRQTYGRTDRRILLNLITI